MRSSDSFWDRIEAWLLLAGVLLLFPLAGTLSIKASEINSQLTPVRLVLPVATKTTAYTVTNSDYTVLGDTTASGFTVTLPASPLPGIVYNVKKVSADANALTIDGNGHTIDGAATIAVTVQYTSYQIQYDGTNWDIL